jgi:hypothetical protein
MNKGKKNFRDADEISEDEELDEEDELDEDVAEEGAEGDAEVDIADDDDLFGDDDEEDFGFGGDGEDEDEDGMDY